MTFIWIFVLDAEKKDQKKSDLSQSSLVYCERCCFGIIALSKRKKWKDT